MQINLKNKVAVVTGGGGILCSVMAKALAKAGAKVAILDLKIEAAQKVAFQKTYDAVIAILSDDAKEYLTNVYGDLTVFITNMIEAEVNRNKG